LEKRRKRKMKKVLVIYYSQSGQLLEITNNITKDLLADSEVDLSFYNIKLEEDYPFPWKKDVFYNAFPESFSQTPESLGDLDNPLLKEKYDLIIYSYQVWYLTPSIPANSFLKSDIATKLFKNTPVVTIIGCRNMWCMAQDKMKQLLLDLDANLVGNIVLTDRHINHVSVVTIVHWMMNADKTKRFLGVFPLPGISQKDIDEATKFSPAVLGSLKTENYQELQEILIQQEATRIKPFLILVDRKANMIFSFWAKLILKKEKISIQKRKRFVKLFSYYLLFAIWVVSPIVFIVYLLAYPFTAKKRNMDINYYQRTALK